MAELGDFAIRLVALNAKVASGCARNICARSAWIHAWRRNDFGRVYCDTGTFGWQRNCVETGMRSRRKSV